MTTTARVWLKVSNLKWIAGKIESVTDQEMLVLTEDGKHVRVQRGSDTISSRTPDGNEDIDNLTDLPYLDEPNLLQSLIIRYERGKIYTRTGPILVAMNPWTNLPLYTNEIMQNFRQSHIDGMHPHIYAISEAAFSNLLTAHQNQSILVSGDSGSGKTESTKFMMKYLAEAAHKVQTTQIEQRVLQCNPLLEAFGNAKTRRNDNSSRFGKYIEIQFDGAFRLVGAKLDTYLLEKSRVVSQADGERNYHIFYQLASQYVADQALSRHIDLCPANEFRYIAKGQNIPVGHVPSNSFEGTVRALDDLGVTAEEKLNIFRALSLILHLGNLDFDSNADGEAVLAIADTQAGTCARLLGVGAAALAGAFLARRIQAGPEELGDAYRVPQTARQASDARDALARALYGAVFDGLVGRVNEALSGRESVATRVRAISILDIFGFEHFTHNAFEQFCINYANEKLQGHFNEFNFSLETQEYQREGVAWTYADLEFQTNARCLELIEDRRSGILALLDEQSIVPNGSDEAFCNQLRRDLADHPYLSARRVKGRQFGVRHYAAEVVYSADDFCFKNKDPVQPALLELVSSSSVTYMRTLAAQQRGCGLGPDVRKLDAAAVEGAGRNGGGGAGGRSTLLFESITAQFKRQLGELMARVAATQPHFVRCVNPNARKEPRLVEADMVLDQLRCSGLMEAVRVSRAGFPVRMPHRDFVARFGLLALRTSETTPPLAAEGGDGREAAGLLLSVLGVGLSESRLGKTKVFLRRAVYERLEEERSWRLVDRVLRLQRVVRGHCGRQVARELRERRRQAAVQALQRAVRRALSRIWYAAGLAKVRALRAQERAAAKHVAPPVTPQAARGGFNTCAEKSLAREVGLDGGSAAGGGMEMQLNSVRELYYGERESLLALTRVVLEACSTSDERAIRAQISSLEALVTRSVGTGEIDGPPPDGVSRAKMLLMRRTDSWRACLLLLRDKLDLVRSRKRAQSQAARAQETLTVTQARLRLATLKADITLPQLENSLRPGQTSASFMSSPLSLGIHGHVFNEHGVNGNGVKGDQPKKINGCGGQQTRIGGLLAISNDLSTYQQPGALDMNSVLSELEVLRKNLECIQQELNSKNDTILDLTKQMEVLHSASPFAPLEDRRRYRTPDAMTSQQPRRPESNLGYEVKIEQRSVGAVEEGGKNEHGMSQVYQQLKEKEKRAWALYQGEAERVGRMADDLAVLNSSQVSATWPGAVRGWLQGVQKKLLREEAQKLLELGASEEGVHMTANFHRLFDGLCGVFARMEGRMVGALEPICNPKRY